MEANPDRTKKNILESDGTLIFSHGKLTGGSAFTRKIANQNSKPYIHVDLNKIEVLTASTEINTWIVNNNIKILNVAGSRASKDPTIHEKVKGVLEAVV